MWLNNGTFLFVLVAELRRPEGAGHQAESHDYRNRTTCMHRSRKLRTLFSRSALLAAWIAGAGVQRRKTTTTSRNMAVIRLRHAALVYSVHIWYWKSMLWDVMVNSHLSKQAIRWPVSRDHIAGSGLELIEVTCFLKLTADEVTVFRFDRRLVSG